MSSDKPTRAADQRMLEALEVVEEELTDIERHSFESMRDYLRSGATSKLSQRQREWLTAVHDRVFPKYENLISEGKAPRGREVATPAVLRRENLPMRPPRKTGSES